MGVALLFGVLLGLFFGVAYNVIQILRIARAGLKKILDKIFIFIEDFLFLFFCGICFSIFIYAVNDGRFRLIITVMPIIGFFIYKQTLGRAILKISDKIIKQVKRFLRFARTMIRRPFIFIWHIFLDYVFPYISYAFMWCYVWVYSTFFAQKQIEKSSKQEISNAKRLIKENKI